MKRLKLFLPLALFIGLALFLGSALIQIDKGEYNPQALPSALIDRPLPEFSLQDLFEEERILTRTDLVGEVALINVWGTWCPSCYVEHPYLNRLAEQGVVIHGLNYKDEAEKARQWLGMRGNPYKLSISDPIGKLGLDLGVTGAPETYVIDREGRVRMRYQGPLDEKIWQSKFQPLLDELNARSAGAAG